MNYYLLLGITLLVTFLVVGSIYCILKWCGFEVPERFLTWESLLTQTRNLGLAYLLSILPNIVVETYLTSGEVSIVLRLSTFLVTYTTVGTLGVMISWFEWYAQKWNKMNRFVKIYLTKTIPSLLFWIPLFAIKTGVIWYAGTITLDEYYALMTWYMLSVGVFAVVPTLIADGIGKKLSNKKQIFLLLAYVIS